MFLGAGPEREEYEGNKRYPFPNVKSEPFMHAVGAASFNYESKTKDSSSSLKDATDYGKGFLKSLSPLMRTELLEVAQIMKFADVVQLISTLMPEMYVCIHC